MTNGNDCAYPADSNTQTEGGITKREYFAAMAMQGILANQSWFASIEDWEEFKDRATSASVEISDALIEELNKTK